jgi:hypothetical protein
MAIANLAVGAVDAHCQIDDPAPILEQNACSATRVREKRPHHGHQQGDHARMHTAGKICTRARSSGTHGPNRIHTNPPTFMRARRPGTHATAVSDIPQASFTRAR